MISHSKPDKFHLRSLLGGMVVLSIASLYLCIWDLVLNVLKTHVIKCTPNFDIQHEVVLPLSNKKVRVKFSVILSLG